MQNPEYGPINPDSYTARAIRQIEGSIQAWRYAATRPAESPIRDDSDMAAAMIELRQKWIGRRPDEH